MANQKLNLILISNSHSDFLQILIDVAKKEKSESASTKSETRKYHNKIVIRKVFKKAHFFSRFI